MRYRGDVLFHTSLDTPGKVLAVILRIALEDGFRMIPSGCPALVV